MSRAARLDDYLCRARLRSFDWATFNCCHFAAQWVHEETGHPVTLEIPAVTCKVEADLAAERVGGSLQGAVTAALGQEPKPATLAQIGDLVLLQEEGVTAVGICTGRYAAFLALESGARFLPMRHAQFAWTIEMDEK